MKEKNTRRGKTQCCFPKGFTLIELLVVVLIIGILAAVALPQYQKAVEKARLSEALTLISDAQKGLDAWLLTNGGMPTTTTWFIGCVENSTNKCSVLDIDVASALTCDQESGTICRSKHFAYQARCSGSTCTITAFRAKNGDIDHNPWEIWMDVDKTGTNGPWKKYCGYCGDDSPYKLLCEGLAPQGWTSGDEC